MAKFSKGHYIILANALLRAKCKLLEEEGNDIGGKSFGHSYTGLTYAMNEIAAALALDNRKFDRDKFVEWVREGNDQT